MNGKSHIKREEIFEIVDEYDKDAITIGVLGSHSALEVAYGAKKEGFKTLVICQQGREVAYTKHYANLFDHPLVLEDFADMVDEEIQEQIRGRNTVFVPHRSFSCYVGYDNIEQRLKLPLFGNRFMLRTEERDVERNQYYLLDKAGIRRPKTLEPEEITSLSIVKMHEAERAVERAFFYASSYEEYKEKARERIEKGIIEEEDLNNATIEEVAMGALFDANYFWSPLDDEVELLGFDRRVQTDLDGVLRLPAEHQLEADVSPQNIAIGHTAVTMRESKLQKVFTAGRQFVDACKEDYPPGMIGPFALQGVMTRKLEFMVFDVSPRVPGAPIVPSTSPYMKYKYGKEIGQGRRVAMEIKKAQKRGQLKRIVT
ncbi:MAG: formate--phosphoribosylaminoimidazolecarboxamide ligase family protein [Candidatus Korarchaeota archaeon]|nr:formate--phosphoribosylaminoimidazolecarboxamide ligase family protein [Candidatus Korarchaeota archaeon]NIU83311.1 DUF1297 domain-containing protein [Candidatus Thorarchaeota archaeon]NIW13646.1 DUF1297 domain-containing protein [Candidatus Thorarchaeota archaeon]NIW51749.1 DUF1297 domain-containing protein [Candidatus Korarchaeota archaeon]